MKRLILAVMFLATGCAGWQRNCDSNFASMAGSDWMIVQFNSFGAPINCWKLPDTSVANEHQSDGIFWEDASSHQLIHISGWYNRVQVGVHVYDSAAEVSQKWEAAAKHLGVDPEFCTNGKYGKF